MPSLNHYPIKASGFTLIEIAISLAIIIILTSIAVPTIATYQKSINLNHESTKLMNELRLAQQRTVSEQIKYSVVFDLPNNSYSLINEQTGATLETVVLPNTLHLINLSGFLNNRATFNPIGAVDYEGQLTVQQTGGKNMLIQVRASGYLTQSKF
ncbi:MAG: hypothetical protein NTV81_02630 [Candidatus Komeilibacteria bacterium]|nr:hypothetical protein [Candidatus Komeilibacteria bacterium]